MVKFSALIGVLATVAAVVAVPINGRTEMPMESKDMGMESKDMGMESKPMEMGMESKPMESKMEEKPMESMPMESKMEEKPMESKMEEKPMESKMEEKPMESKMAEKPMETSMAMAAETSSAKAAEATSPAYGSGSMDKSGYNDCVSQCMAKFGGGESNKYTPASSGETQGSSGEGATHTVIVAPAQGVLRYVPPFVDAAVGDTVMFKWGANNHTVTKGSALTPCNKSADALFASGSQNKDFTFTQKVNDTSATFFYCATTGHCPKGMFGVINMAKASEGSNSSVGAMMNSTNSSMSAESSKYADYTKQMTANNSMAASWGSSYDMSSMPDWAKEPMMQNVMYMRNVIAMNPDIMGADGKVNMASTAPMMLPNDVNLAATTNTGGSNGGPAGPAASASATEAGVAAAQSSAAPVGAAAQPNGAGSVTASKYVMGAAVVFATFFLL